MPTVALYRRHQPSDWLASVLAIAPGVLLCGAVTALAYALEAAETALTGKAWIEALVLAILAGTAIRTAWSPSNIWHKGIAFSAKFLLEIAVVLLGASVSAATLLAAGPGLLAGIAIVVATAILASFGIARALGLPVRMALLVACGNSICGNSAIAAVAPVIGADSDDVAASIAFTAVLGVLVVLGLPLVGYGLGMSAMGFGALSGLTVYAVPQVIAAASAFGALAIQTGTLVKLVRVLMLGPVCLVLSFVAPRIAPQPELHGETIAGEPVRKRPGLAQMVPWFIIGFILLVVCRSLGFIPQHAISPISHTAGILTVISMAALGLGVDVRTVASAGVRVSAAVTLSLVALGALSITLLSVLHFV
ncbi:MAG: putative sulfate exporter family transporter [Sphingomonadaceae bacterium]